MTLQNSDALSEKFPQKYDFRWLRLWGNIENIPRVAKFREIGSETAKKVRNNSTSFIYICYEYNTRFSFLADRTAV